MLIAVHDAVGRLLVRLLLLASRRSPVLLLGREGRWQWPWVLVGVGATWLLFHLLVRAGWSFEDLAILRGWISSDFFRTKVFPFNPYLPLTYLYNLWWLPYLLPPLIVLPLVHGVSWRRAFSYGTGFQWPQFWRAATAKLAVLSLFAALSFLLWPQQHEFRPHALELLPWVALGFGAILVRTLGEDVFFLGYLLRTWGAVLAYPLPVAGAVAAYFLYGHLGNASVQWDVALALFDLAISTAISIAVVLRTQNLAAAAGLHWINNVFIFLLPTIPEQVSPLALVVFHRDPAYAVGDRYGNSYLFEPLTLAVQIVQPALLLVLLLWRRSPFHLAKAPLPHSVAG